MKKIFLLIIFWACIGVLQAQEHFSAASFYPVPNSGREVLDFNPGWRFHRGDIPLKADPLQLDDSKWELVNLPHTVQLVPSEASGSRNYQGPAWYSKRFTVDTLGIKVSGCPSILRRLWVKAAFISMVTR